MSMVLALHLSITKSIAPSWLLKCNYGIACIAIPLFFMVSGYLLSTKTLDAQYAKRKIKGILKFVFLTITALILYYELHDIIRFGFAGAYARAPHCHVSTYWSWIIQGGGMWQYWYFGSMIIIYTSSPLCGKVFKSKYHLQALLALVAISFVFFIANSIYDFEKTYIKQTFRVWYWFMYFMLGAYIQLHRERFTFIKWWHAVLMCIVYTLFQVSGVAGAKGNEFYFGSIICMLYAISVFGACINTKIESSRTITTLSALFLPVYAIHPTVYGWMSHMSFVGSLDPFSQYFVVLILAFAINVTLGLVIMHTPYIKDIFKI